MIEEVGARGSAIYSDCRRYRYRLTRSGLGCGARSVTFVMLNPSTATADDDDPTIRKCQRFTALFGGSELTVVNLYAFRATAPDDLFRTPAPIGGPENDEEIYQACSVASLVVCAWGSDRRALGRASEVTRMLRGRGVRLYRLGDPAKNGQPWHPLYRAYATPLQELT